MSNIYYKPGEPRRIFKKPLTTNQYVQGVGRCTHCPRLGSYCDACRKELSGFKTHEAAEEYERQVQASLPLEGAGQPSAGCPADILRRANR